MLYWAEDVRLTGQRWSTANWVTSARYAMSIELLQGEYRLWNYDTLANYGRYPTLEAAKAAAEIIAA